MKLARKVRGKAAFRSVRLHSRAGCDSRADYLLQDIRAIFKAGPAAQRGEFLPTDAAISRV